MSKGSEWRQWDLHFHTPSSYDYENPSVTNQEIIDKLVFNNVSAVAITDHHIIDVPRIKELQKLGLGKITIFPGIEFLSDSRGKEPIHFIAIFPDKSDLDYIWGQIENRTEIRRIKGEGKAINEIYCNLSSTCELVHSLGGIVSIHAGSKSNSIDKISNSLPQNMAMKDDISGYIDIFDMGKEEDLEGYRNNVFPSIRRVVPMIISSDNHNVLNYSRKEKTWIKADISFEGLKQIIYEPEERVCISSSKPDEKSIYNIIDYISFAEPGFWEGSISFSHNLNTIIGGRSTGKSSLLDVIAAKHNCKELDKSDHIWNHVDKVEIGWADGNKQIERDIEFFPQSYMHQIARDPNRTNSLVEQIILHKDIGGLLNELKEKQQSNQKTISEGLFSMFGLYDELNKERKNLSELGAKDGVKQQISLLQSKISDVQNGSTLSAEENAVYQGLEKQIKDKQTLIENAERDINSLSKIRSVSPIRQNFDSECNLNLLLFGTNASESNRLFISLKERSEKEWIQIIDTLISHTNDGIKRIQNEIDLISKNEIYIKGIKHYAGNKELKDLSEKLNTESKHLKEIERLEAKIESLRGQLNNLLKVVINAHYALKTDIQNVIDKLSVNVDGLFIKVSMLCLKDKMRELLENRLIMRGASRQEYVNNIVDNYENDTVTHSKKFILDLIKGNIELKGSTIALSLATEFLANSWFYLNYELNYQGDSFDKMSEGKQAFVILKLLLEFSDKQCPILIDQPEDSLDNRAIYNELVSYIKKKKKVRQIILVTHNSNVVVSADAENVIVANQDGQDCPNDAGNQFEYINGPLENSYPKDSSIQNILKSQGIREHVCDILEGGKDAFKKREQKYGL